jgi:crotonobetainyl-CoA:carnitine CoA-transferase CaiB-like acyl-CoA transferase
MKQPLEGIRILDCGIFHAGPGGSAILGDLGAEVIKVEQPGQGDPIRSVMRIGSIPFEIPGKRNIFCEGANRNKKSVTLDLKSEKGREILHRLVRRSDVFMTNMRRPAVESLKITYAELRAINPMIIYATVSAFGPNGPDKDRGGFDYQGQARAGMMYATGEEGMPPMVSQFGLADQVTAIMGSHQILTALLMRERFGIGQKVQISILGCTMFLNYFNLLIAQMGGFEVPRHRRSTEHPLRNYYQCKDDRWLMMTLTPPEKYWGVFCEALDAPELQHDTRFHTDDKRLENAEQLNAILDKIFKTRTRDQWLEHLAQYDLFCAGVNTFMDLVNDPQVVENDYLIDFDHPTMGRIKMPGYPVHFSESWAQISQAAPEVGEHTDEILTKLAGLTPEEIEALREEGVV